LSILFRTKRHLTIDQLTRAWGPELARADRGGDAHEQDLVGLLLEDIINGRLDDVGPLRDGRRLGLRLITPEGRAGFLEGAQLRDLAQTGAGSAVIFHRVLIMKEAVLDFALQHELPPPSWWADPVHASNEAASNTAVVDTASRSGAAHENASRPRLGAATRTWSAEAREHQELR
jgi:hypothetical protein